MNNKSPEPERFGYARLSRPGGDPFSIEAYLERQWAEFEHGPTAADILARAW